MVNTRRMESSGSTGDRTSRLSRKVTRPGDEGNSDSCSSSDLGPPSQEEESWSSQYQWEKKQSRRIPLPNPTRVRELRNRFVCSDLSYAKRRVSKSQRMVRLDGCSNRTYPGHNMQGDSDDFLEDSDEIFSPRKFDSRHLRHSTRSRLRRSEPEADLRRSTRQRKLQYNSFNTSWITDVQMIKGYPNLNTNFMSDQESRHSQQNGHMDKMTTASPPSNEHDMGEDSCDVEHKKNLKYMYRERGYEPIEMRSRRITSRVSQPEQDPGSRHHHHPRRAAIKKEDVNADDAEDHVASQEENKDGDDLGPPQSASDSPKENGMTADDTVMVHDQVNGDVIVAEPLKEEQEGAQDGKPCHTDSESEHEIRRTKKQRRSTTLKYMDDPRFSPRHTRNRKSDRLTDSEKSSDSSEDEDLRNQRYKYQLRTRKPKSDMIKTPEDPRDGPPLRRSDRLLHNICARRHRPRRRDTSDDDSMPGEMESHPHPRARKADNVGKHRMLPGGSGGGGTGGVGGSGNGAGGVGGGVGAGDNLNIEISKKTEGQVKSGQAQNSAPAPIVPETLDARVRFASVGGLDNHVRCLREMVVLPMMYPEVFKQFQIQPPRGVLFHGPPGTGKTLIARALANECSFGSRKVSFFMRKGADLLSKWVGESEKQLRMLFEQAAQMKPSIIFFDELDGLAPVRSSRQDQIHASIVTTLLALMDGLNSRGEVIVIGATNRIDAIDPALRRPGRFDRELYFPLPARREREEIIRVHVSQWCDPPTDALIGHLAEHSAGYCGSDLRALCSEAVIQGLRRTYPQVYTTDHRLQLDPTRVRIEKIDFLRARSLLVPASHRVTQGLGRKLPAMLEPLLRGPLDTVLTLLREIFPHGLEPALASVKLSESMQTAQLLLTGDTHAQGQSIYLAPALLFRMEHVNAYTLDLAVLHRESGRTPEEGCVEVFNEARRNVPSVIYVPGVEQWWSLVGDTVRAIFLSQLARLDPGIPILLLATANVEYRQLPDQIGAIFSTYRKEVLHLSPPVTTQREAFFRPLLVGACLRPPRPPRVRPETPPPLPRAPTPQPEPLTEQELKKLYDKEEQTLTELRIFLRDMCKKLASNKMFYMFTKPVDLEEAPDYLSIIKEPMDLETMMTKVDMHQYSCAREFLDDIDLICRNALEYNPAKTPADKQIRHRACSLKDHAHAMIKAELDSDFEDHCVKICQKRKERKTSVSQFLPPFIYTQPLNSDDAAENLSKEAMEDADTTADLSKSDVGDVKFSPGGTELPPKVINCRFSPSRKRKMPSWARGFLKNRKRKRVSRSVLTEAQQQQDEGSQDEPPLPAKSLSGDESKENKPALDDTEEQEVPLPAEASVDVQKPLTVICDGPTVHHASMEVEVVSAPVLATKIKDTLSPAIWPSFADLMNDAPQVEDHDDGTEEVTSSGCAAAVDVDVAELEAVLKHAVSTTRGCSVLSLMDLYGQLHRVVSKYTRTHARKSLPQDLQQEITRFQEIQQRKPVSTSRCSTPAS